MKSCRATAPSPGAASGRAVQLTQKPGTDGRSFPEARARKASLGRTKLQYEGLRVQLDLTISILKATRPANAMGTIVQTGVFSIGSYFYTCGLDLVILHSYKLHGSTRSQ